MKTITAIKVGAKIAEIFILMALGVNYGPFAVVAGGALIIIGGINLATYLWEAL